MCSAMRFCLAAVMLALAWPAGAGAVAITPVTSPGGITAWLVEDHTRPIITVRLRFPRGSTGDPEGREGLAYLASGLLDEGAGDLDSDAFRAALEGDSIALGFDAGLDSFSASLVTLTETSAQAFRLLRLALTEPRFDPEPLDRVRDQVIAGMRARRESPSRRAHRAWWTAAFPDHPYGRPLRGTMASVQRITGDDLAGFARRTLTREGLVIGVVGDITPERLGGVLDTVLGGLPASSGPIAVPPTAPAMPGEVMVVDRDVPQSVVVFGHDGIGRHDPDWYAASILFEVLAGGFGSRLTREIRERRGLAYSVFAYPVVLDHAALVYGTVSTANARVAETIGLIRKIWRDLAANGPTAQEVLDAKGYINGSRALALTNSRSIAGVLVAVQDAGLGIDYLDRRADLVDAVALDDLRRVAARLFREPDLTLVVAGRPERLNPTRPAPVPDP